MKWMISAVCIFLFSAALFGADGEGAVNAWRIAVTDQTPRFWSGAVWDAENKGVHVWGGLRSNNVERFDPKSGKWMNQYESDPWKEIGFSGYWSAHPELRWVKRTNRPRLYPFVWDQLAYDPSRKKVYYFLGGQTLAYDVARATWERLTPQSSPPGIQWGAMAYDPVHKEILLFGGGGVYERRPGMWVYSPDVNAWKKLECDPLPPSRACSPLAVDERNKVLVVFGGDAQDRLLDDTWIFDLEKRRWRQSKSVLYPDPRCGHGLAWEPASGLVFMASGFTRIWRSGSVNGGRRMDLSNETWAYDVKTDKWRRVKADLPKLKVNGWPKFSTAMVGFTNGVILIQNQNDGKPALRHTLVMQVDGKNVPFMNDDMAQAAIKRSTQVGYAGNQPPKVPEAHRAKALEQLQTLPSNRWIKAHPLRETEYNHFGNMHYDYAGERVVYWGGGHSTHQHNHLAFYDPALNTWWDCWPPESMPPPQDSNNGASGLTFKGRPWNTHTGTRYYSWDSIDKVMVYGGDMWQATEPTGTFKMPWTNRYGHKRRETMGYIDPETTEFTDADASWPGQLVNTPGRVLGLWSDAKGTRGSFLNANALCHQVGIFLPREKQWELAKIQGEFKARVIAYDSKRERLISIIGNTVYVLDPKTGAVEKKTAGGDTPHIGGVGGEVYVPKHDVVIFGIRSSQDKQSRLFTYSVARNELKHLPVRGSQGCGDCGTLVYSPKYDILISKEGGTHLMRYVPSGEQKEMGN